MITNLQTPLVKEKVRGGLDWEKNCEREFYYPYHAARERIRQEEDEMPRRRGQEVESEERKTNDEELDYDGDPIYDEEPHHEE